MTNDRMSTFEMGTQSILIRNDKVPTPREGVRKICKVGEFELNFQKKNAKFLKCQHNLLAKGSKKRSGTSVTKSL